MTRYLKSQKARISSPLLGGLMGVGIWKTKYKQLYDSLSQEEFGFIEANKLCPALAAVGGIFGIIGVTLGAFHGLCFPS
jgi:hypothetical protein